MQRRTIASGIGMLTAAALIFSAAPAATAAPAAPPAAPVVASAAGASTQTPEQRAEGLTTLLEQVTAIPDDVLQAGDEATQAWIDENLVAAGDDGTVVAKASVLGCAGSIAVALAGVAFPAAKLLKIKKLADELGGVKKAVDLLWGASFNYEKVQAAGGALASLGAELIGIASIKEQCFE